MSCYDEIKQLFSNEIVNCPQYSLCLNIKDKIIEEINTPKVSEFVYYNLDVSTTDEDINNLKLCSILIFGFEFEINNYLVIINMKKFLN